MSIMTIKYFTAPLKVKADRLDYRIILLFLGLLPSLLAAGFVIMLAASARQAISRAEAASSGLEIVLNGPNLSAASSYEAKVATAPAAGTHQQNTSKPLVILPPISVPLKTVPSGYGVSLGDTLQWLSQSDLDKELADIKQVGFSWIRIDYEWKTVQASGPNAYNWSVYDSIAQAASKHQLKVLPILAYAPQWARLPACSTSDKCAPANPNQFASFAAAAAKRYSAQGISYWEIWNEPNLYHFWQPAPDPGAYTALLKSAYPAILSAEPGAIVISGGLGPLDRSSASLDPLTFLSDLYSNGAKNYFDGVGFHPYSFPNLPDQVATWSGWSKMNDLPASARSIMTANGDSAKLIWLTEFGAPTNGPGAGATLSGYSPGSSPDHVDEALQAAMASHAVRYIKSSSWIGPMFWYSYKDLGTSTSTNENFFGMLRADGSQKPVYSTFKSLLAQ